MTDDEHDFDVDAARSRGVQVMRPDEFGVWLLDRDPVPVLRAVQRVPRERYERFLARMRDDGLSRTADAIRDWFDEVEDL